MTLLHPAVIYAGAETRLDREGQFNLTEFFDAVEKIVLTLPKEE